MLRLASLSALLSLGFMVVACSAKKAEPPPAEKAPAAAEPSSSEPPKGPTLSPPAPTSAPNPGSGVRHPGWFREDLWPGAKVTKRGRSEVDANGRFSSQILFDLPAGTTAEHCAAGFVDKVRGEVANVAVDPNAQGPAGRVTARGNTNHYRVTIVCGEAEGVMKGYVGYAWTQAPPP